MAAEDDHKNDDALAVVEKRREHRDVGATMRINAHHFAILVRRAMMMADTEDGVRVSRRRGMRANHTTNQSLRCHRGRTTTRRRDDGAAAANKPPIVGATSQRGSSHALSRLVVPVVRGERGREERGARESFFSA